MPDLDTILARLRDEPPHPRLGTLDSSVMAEIARLQAMPSVSTTTFGVAVAAALFIGVAGSAVSTSPADASPISPFDARLALAPSTLLGTP